MLELIDLFHALQLSVFAYVFSCILTEDGYILSWYDDLLIDLESKAKWLAYPLGRCEKCFAGQLALWFWIFINYNSEPDNWPLAILKLGLFISFTIIFVHIISIAIKRCKK